MKRKTDILKQKKKIIGSMFICALMVSCIFAVLFVVSPSVKAVWWDSGWHYYKKVSLSNANNSCVIKINVTASSGGDVNCGGHCNANFSDLRFIDVDNTTNMAYWIERSVASSFAVCWVNTSSNIASDGALLLYYGNVHAPPVSSGNNTFAVFEDYSLYGSSSVPLGKFTLFYNTSGGNQALYNYRNVTNSFNISAKLGNNMRYVFKYQVTGFTASGTDVNGVYGMKKSTAFTQWTTNSRFYQDMETSTSGGYNCVTNTTYGSDTNIFYGATSYNLNPSTGCFGVNYASGQPIYTEFDFGPNAGYYVQSKTYHYNNMSQLGTTLVNSTYAGFAFTPKQIIIGFSHSQLHNFGFNAANDVMWFVGKRTGGSYMNYSVYWFFVGKIAYPETTISGVSSEYGSTDVNVFSLKDFTIIGSYTLVTFGGKQNQTVWCNNSGIRHETPEMNMTINTTTNITEIRVRCMDLNDTTRHTIGAGNMSIQFCSDNSSWGSPGNVRSFVNGGSNISINKTTWTIANGCYGTNPFNGTGLINKTASIRFRLRLHLHTTYSNTFTTAAWTSCKVYLGYYP